MELLLTLNKQQNVFGTRHIYAFIASLNFDYILVQYHISLIQGGNKEKEKQMPKNPD